MQTADELLTPEVAKRLDELDKHETAQAIAVLLNRMMPEGMISAEWIVPEGIISVQKVRLGTKKSN